VTAVANGTTTISAATGSVSGAATVDVAQRVVSVVVTPASATVTGIEQFVQFAAAALDANGHVVAGLALLWASSDVSVARVNASGRAISVGFGTATISATAAGVTGTAAFVVQ
jgi:hypothetical protein